MRILDLFCGGGGAGEGYRRAFPGAYIIGVDMSDHPAYELIGGNTEFIKDDALDFLWARGREFDLIHASPLVRATARTLARQTANGCRPAAKPSLA